MWGGLEVRGLEEDLHEPHHEEMIIAIRHIKLISPCRVVRVEGPTPSQDRDHPLDNGFTTYKFLTWHLERPSHGCIRAHVEV